MKVEKGTLAGVLVLTPRRFEDARGYFCETFRADAVAHIGIERAFVQDNESFSARAGTIRGLHFQKPPHAQAKLVRVLRGAIFDAIVDLRMNSPTYGRWEGFWLDAREGRQLFVPRGFAHGFRTLEPDTLVAYKVDDFYARDHEDGFVWNDPDLGIDWPHEPALSLLSPKDAALPGFSGFRSPFHGEG